MFTLSLRATKRSLTHLGLLAGVALTFSCASLFANDDKLTMNMQGADIRALIQWISDNTGKNIVVHKDVQGEVTVLSSAPVTTDEAYQVFLSVLQVHGFAVIETPEALKISLGISPMSVHQPLIHALIVPTLLST